VGVIGSCRIVGLGALNQLDVESTAKVVSAGVEVLLFETTINGIPMSFPLECSGSHKSGGDGQETDDDAQVHPFRLWDADRHRRRASGFLAPDPASMESDGRDR
jgi:hypothetical protein